MRARSYHGVRLFLVLVVVGVALSTTPGTVKADPPALTVYSSWKPATQLASIDSGNNKITNSGDDLRYVDAEIDVTTNVVFWAMELTCTVNPAALEDYVQNDDAGGTGDDVPPVTWGTVWQSAPAKIDKGFVAATGARTILAANFRDAPVGKSMVTTTFPIATIRYLVKPLIATATSPFTCTGSFLNTNGNPVITPTFVAPTPLTIIPDYTIVGNVAYQGRMAKNGIGIQCVNGSTYSATSDTSGNFTIHTRRVGTYACTYYGNTSPHAALAPDKYLAGSTRLALSTFSYRMLPVSLLGGNVNPSGATQAINSDDLATVTSNYETQGMTTADINGDGKVDKTDIAILAGNYFATEPTDASHVVYGLTTGLVTNGSRLWFGPGNDSRVNQLIPGTNVDNWPAFSPDGTKIVFTRRLGAAAPYHYALFIMNADGTGTARQITPTTGPNSLYDAYAPSWSPDGSKVAFSCASASNALIDDAALCVTDPAAHTFIVLGAHFHIFPPAWDGNDRLVVGGSSANLFCANDLCVATLSLGNYTSFDVLGETAANDMPVISNGALFYRTPYSPGEYHFRMADLDNNGNILVAYPSAPGSPYHVQLPYVGAFDYLAVKAGSRDAIGGDRSGTVFFPSSYTGSGSWVIYGGIFIPGTVPSPSWDGIEGDSSYVYALRNTFTWLP